MISQNKHNFKFAGRIWAINGVHICLSRALNRYMKAITTQADYSKSVVFIGMLWDFFSAQELLHKGNYRFRFAIRII